MRKYLLLFSLISFTGILQAQQALTTMRMQEPVRMQFRNAQEENTIKFGYSLEEIGISLGVGANVPVRLAIQIPQETAARYAGSKISKLLVGLGGNAVRNPAVFVTTDLNATSDYTQDVSLTINTWNEITLDTSFDITGSTDIYVGYTFTSGTGNNYYSIGLDDSTVAEPYGGFLSYMNGSSYSAWQSLEEMGFPNLTLIAIIDGETVPMYDANLQKLTYTHEVLDPGKVFEINGTLKNEGAATLTSFDINYKLDNGETITEQVTGVNIPNYSRHDFSISGTTPATEGDYVLEVNISNLNGNADQYESNNTQARNLYISELYSSPAFVDTEPSQKNVVLEEFTGLHCINCPDGHKIANQIKDTYPGRVSVINIHQGGYARTTPDYRTEWADAIAEQSGLSGYPMGTINRHLFSGSATAVSRTLFSRYSEQILAEDSYVNIASKAWLNTETRELIVDVELYYTDDSPAAENKLNVAILQDNILGPQTGKEYYPAMVEGDLYRHNHMLRDLLSGQWGTTIEQTTAGTFVVKRYIYTVPDHVRKIDIELNDLEIVAFLAEGNQEIITGTISSLIACHLVKDITATSEEVNGSYNVELSWTAPENAVSFTVYRDDTMVAEKITQTSFTDNGLADGTYTYSFIAHYEGNMFCDASGSASIVVETSGLGITNTFTGNVNIYPNPTTGKLQVDNGSLNIRNIRMYDIAGKMVYKRENVNETSTVLDVASLEAGIYLLNVDGKTYKVRKQ